MRPHAARHVNTAPGQRGTPPVPGCAPPPATPAEDGVTLLCGGQLRQGGACRGPGDLGRAGAVVAGTSLARFTELRLHRRCDTGGGRGTLVDVCAAAARHAPDPSRPPRPARPSPRCCRAPLHPLLTPPTARDHPLCEVTSRHLSGQRQQQRRTPRLHHRAQPPRQRHWAGPGLRLLLPPLPPPPRCDP
jgi:hypothetical protein